MVTQDGADDAQPFLPYVMSMLGPRSATSALLSDADPPARLSLPSAFSSYADPATQQPPDQHSTASVLSSYADPATQPSLGPRSAASALSPPPSNTFESIDLGLADSLDPPLSQSDVDMLFDDEFPLRFDSDARLLFEDTDDTQ